MGPNNGAVNTGAIVGASFSASGYATAAGATVNLQVLSSPTVDPSVEGNWTTIKTVTASNSPTDVNGDSLYSWQAIIVPVPTAATAGRWPAGGLAKIRAQFPGTGIGVSFDEVTQQSCTFGEYGAGTSGKNIGLKCQGLGRGINSMVSAASNPATLGTRSFLSTKGDISEAETAQYYTTNHLPDTLPNFKTTFNYPGAAGEVSAVYFNDGDLGIGRDLHCWQYTTGSGLTTVDGLACYVTNFSDTAGVAKFGTNNVTQTLALATAHSGGFATVAMVYSKLRYAVGRGSVRFVAFNSSNARVNAAQLDNLNAHRSIPNNCLTCHGLNASYDSATHTVQTYDQGPQFLPFDPTSYVFSSAPGFTRPNQEEAFRKLNAMIRDVTQPTAAITALIDGSYAPSTVTTIGASWNDNFVPSTWLTATGHDTEGLYRGVVKSYCRTCHISAGADLDFAESSDFDSYKPTIINRACKPSQPTFMPHAEHVMRKFWSSGARAYLNSWSLVNGWADGSADHTGCKP